MILKPPGAGGVPSAAARLPSAWRSASFLAPLCAVLLSTAASSPARAVVVDQLGGGNFTAPADDPGWNNVGAIWVGGGVYLGDGWVLTADHIGSGSGFTLGGTTYQMVPGTGHQLTNNGVAGKSTYTDLYLFRVDGRPNVPNVTVASVGAQIGDAVTMIGRGRNQEATRTLWTVNTSVDPWSWTESPPASNPNALGFKTTPTQSMSWGKNVIDQIEWESDGLDFRTLVTTFNLGSSAIAGEGQVVYGDSGGGVFVKQGGRWNLAGIIIAQGAYSGQPAATGVFGDESYIADLSFYHDQIVAITVPEPGAGTQVAVAGGAAGLAWLVRRVRRRV